MKRVSERYIDIGKVLFVGLLQVCLAVTTGVAMAAAPEEGGAAAAAAMKCPGGFSPTTLLDVVFTGVNQSLPLNGEAGDFFVFDIGSAIVSVDGAQVVPAGSHWVAQGTLYLGGAVSLSAVFNPDPSKAVGKWVCQGGIMRSSTIFEPTGPVGRDLGIGNFNLIFRSEDPEKSEDLHGNYTARTIDIFRDPGVPIRTEIKTITAGTGANAKGRDGGGLDVNGIIITATTYRDANYNMLLRYSLSRPICAPSR
jgi:hypothetical protein